MGFGFFVYLCGVNSKKVILMATITLNYDAHNDIAVKTLQYVLSLGLFSTKARLPRTTSSFEKSMREMEAGKTHRLKDTNNPLAEILH